MNNELINEVKNAIELLKKDIILKQQELDSLIEQYNELVGDTEEQ